MNKTAYLIASLALLATPLASCESDASAVEERDWQGTTTFFQSVDDKKQDTYYKPFAGFVGDPMPFFDPVAKDFKVLYLQDYRPNPAATYHPIWAVSTKDAAHYTSLGELIPCGGAAEQDAALGTGSTIYDETQRTYYTFYTGNKHQPRQGDNAQVVMVATSADFKTWTKSQTFVIRGNEYGYSANDFRDPYVYKAEDGSGYRMLVATYKDGKGVLAEFSSADLKAWKHVGVFMTMMWDRFYECPDLFKMGDWWYLVYSEKHAAVRRVQYFKGRTLDELKAATANDAGKWPDDHEGFLDSRGFYAGKTASDGTNRYIWGWCPTRPGNNNTDVGAYPHEPEWAGNLVVHRLIQHADGTLTLGEVPAINTQFGQNAAPKLMAQSTQGVTQNGDNMKLQGEAWALFPRLGQVNRISFTVKTAANTDKFGISFVRGTDSEKWYTLVINPEGADKRKVNFEEEGSKGKGFVEGIDGYVFARPADNTYNVTIYTDNSVLVMYINDVCCYTNRIYNMAKNCWSINSYGGEVNVSNLNVGTTK